MINLKLYKGFFQWCRRNIAVENFGWVCKGLLSSIFKVSAVQATRFGVFQVIGDCLDKLYLSSAGWILIDKLITIIEFVLIVVYYGQWIEGFIALNIGEML